MTVPATVPDGAILCTAVTGPTARSAKVLLDDLRALHPGAPVLVVDLDGSAATWAGTDVTVLPAEQLVDEDEVHHAVALHGLRAALHWLRPLALLAALEAAPCALWLDPTSLVLAPLHDVARAATRARVALAVVRRRPATAPGDAPDGDAQAGTWSAAVVAATREARPVLRTWAARRRVDASEGPGLDAVVADLPHVEVADAGLAVSSWSLRGRRLTGTAEAPSLDGAAVRHLDLTGFDPERPWVLDGDVRTHRILLSEHPTLAALLASHGARLRAVPAVVSRYERLADGTPVSPAVQHAYRLAASSSTPPPDPFDADRPEAFTAWLAGPVAGTTPPLSRYLAAVRDARADLQQAFPQVPGDDVPRLLTWAAEHGTDELDGHLVAASLAAAGPLPPPAPARRPSRLRAVARRVLDPAPRGLNVVGFLKGELGIGESARLVLRALGTTRVRHAATAVSRNLASRENATFAGPPPPRRPYDTTLICVNADLTPAVTAQVPELVVRRHRIGMWYWEVEEFPVALHGAFDSVDEVWVATDFVREAIGRHSPVPVHTVPPPLPRPRPTTHLTRADLGLPDGFVFLFSFDYLSTAERKNPLGLVEAFRLAFPRGSGPTLVIKSINAEARLGDAERLRLAVTDEPDVILLEQYLDPDERDALTLLADCYVSLHRAEGLGLTMAEAMALGKPVIGTAYGGNLQFMTPENSWLVPAERVPIPPGCDPYPAGTPWGEPDPAAAAAAMRAVVDDPAEARRRGARAAHDVATLHSPEVAGRAIAERLAAPRGRRR